MKRIFALAGLLAMGFVVKAQKPDARLAGLDTMITRILKEWNVPGVSVSVVEKNKVLFTGGFGYKDYENKKPVTENTQFAIGSCTKAFTASLVGLAIKEKGIDLDAPVSTYFPKLKFLDNTLTASVTLRDMLCHRTGVPRHDYSWYSGAATTRENLVHNIRFLEASAPLRQNFQYNNYMYMAIGNLLEHQYGKSWEELIQEKLFSKLSMKNSTTSTIAQDGDFSYGYIYKNNRLQKLDFLTSQMKGVAPCGGIVSNAKDMANWLLMWTNQGQFEGKGIISQSFYKEAISSQMIASANLPSKFIPDYYFFNYGLGWYTANYRGHYGVGHGGNINGFSSFVSFLPTDSIGVFVSVNQNNSEVPRILTNIINDRMIGATYRDWNAIMKMQNSSKVTDSEKKENPSKPSHPLPEFTGAYKNDAYGTITIKNDRENLTGTFNRWNLTIKHVQYNYFRFSINETVFDGSEAINGEFTIGTDGSISSLKMPFESGVKDIEFVKQPSTQVITKDGMVKYCGDYDFNGTVIKVYLTETNVLKAVVPGQPEYELVPVKQDEFAIKGAKGVSIKFDRDDKGNIPSSTFIQPNGSFKVKRISTTKAETQSTQKKENKQTAVDKESFAKYLGDYNLGGQNVKIFVADNVLKAILPGQPEYTLVIVKENEFSIKGAKGYSLKFNADEKGNIGGFTLTQPNGTMSAVKK